MVDDTSKEVINGSAGFDGKPVATSYYLNVTSWVLKFAESRKMF